MSNNFGKNLKFLRRLSGFTQTQLADVFGIKRNNISSYESGFAEPKLVLLLKIADYFDVEMSQLLEEEMEKSEPDLSAENVEIIDKNIALKFDMKQYLHITNEGQKILDGFIAFQKMKNVDSNGMSDNVELDRLLKILDALLSNNWALLNAFQDIHTPLAADS